MSDTTTHDTDPPSTPPEAPGSLLFVSTATYAMGKAIGFEEASAEFQRQLEEPTADSLQCVRVIARLRMLEQVAVWHDASATSIGKSRSRAFHEFLRSNADVWVTVDDDVEADTQTLRWLLAAVRSTTPRVCLAPCLTRGSNVVNVALPRFRLDADTRELPGGGRVMRVLAGGFGLVAISRLAAETMATFFKNLAFLDDDQQLKLAVFQEMLAREPEGHHTWCGEDVSFCRRAQLAGVQTECLLTGYTVHDGQALKLADVEHLGEITPGGRGLLP